MEEAGFSDAPSLRESPEAAAKPTAPKRIRLSRAKGWKMPPNTVKVDRSTPWGNPFVVGVDGTRAECVDLHRMLLAGYICLSCKAEPEPQRAHRRHVSDRLDSLRGKNLACWCALDGPCHADTLLMIANARRFRKSRKDGSSLNTTGETA